MTDVTPSEYIFKELQAVHATGLLTDQLSLEDEWQQTFFEMDQVLSSSPNARINTNYNNNQNNNNNNIGGLADPIQVGNQLVSANTGTVAANPTTNDIESDSPTVTSDTTTTSSSNINNVLINQDDQRAKCEQIVTTTAIDQNNDNYLHHHQQLHQNNSDDDNFSLTNNDNMIISSLSATRQQNPLNQTVAQLEEQALTCRTGNNDSNAIRVMGLIARNNQMIINHHAEDNQQQQPPSPTFYFCPTIVTPCDVSCANGTLIAANNIGSVVMSHHRQQQQSMQSQKQQQTPFNKTTTKQRSSSSTAAAQHTKSTKDRPTRLDCPFCERTFCKNFDLQQHMRCHTGEKPFQCIVCGRGFAQKSNVKKHMQAHKVWPDGSAVNAASAGAPPTTTSSTTNTKTPNDGQTTRSRSSSTSGSSNLQCRANNVPDQTATNPYNLDEGSNDEREDRVGTMSDNTNSSLGGGLVPFGFCNHRSDLSNEEATPTIDNRYACSYCKFNGRTYFELKSHLTVHKREKVFKCIVSSCGQTFAGNDLQSFLEHVTNHKNELVYRCHLCSSQFNSLSELGYHQHEHNILIQTNTQQLHHQHQPQQQQPSPYSTNSEHDQQQQKQQLYQKQTRSGAQKYFRCSKCMNRYTTLTALEHHISISSHHYPCTECDKVFPCERYLRRHLNTHTSILHVCTYCDKQFKTAAYLKMHKIVHTGEKPFQCNLCDAAFNRRDKLNRHKLTHEPFKKYKCPFKHHTGCPKEFNRADKLKAHILTHSGIRPHQCNICERAFSRQTHLREHKKLLHETSFNISQLTMDTNSNISMQIDSNIDIHDD